MEELKLNINDIARLKSNNLSLEEKAEIIKCSKPHITNLPYDRRTTDSLKLTERLNAIDSKISELRQENANLESSRNRYHNEVRKCVENNRKNIDDLKTLFDSEITLDDDEIGSTDIYTKTGKWFKERFKKSLKNYEKVVNQHNEIEKQIDKYWEDYSNNNVTAPMCDTKLLEDYLSSCEKLNYDVELWKGIGNIINNDSFYIMNEDFRNSASNLSVESGFLKGYYQSFQRYDDNINENNKMIEDLFDEGFLTQDKLNEVRGFYDRDEQGDGLL